MADIIKFKKQSTLQDRALENISDVCNDCNDLCELLAFGTSVLFTIARIEYLNKRKE